MSDLVLQQARGGLRCAISILEGANIIGPKVLVVKQALAEVERAYDDEGTRAAEHRAAEEVKAAAETVARFLNFEAFADDEKPSPTFEAMRVVLNAYNLLALHAEALNASGATFAMWANNTIAELKREGEEAEQLRHEENRKVVEWTDRALKAEDALIAVRNLAANWADSPDFNPTLTEIHELANAALSHRTSGGKGNG